ncbi:MAG: flagellar basal body-associated FliL family protein [Hydrogenophaga sp.]|jgi:flagellar FliL protein|uniref:flagellar basal body-associated FliL family protein n=1 Tax=Hydrogenophaga sp. TaxID=1904254 RepID=UPI001D6CD175|nr:flagellar basal body-associated FliL family protein [Hydrogenophaga sp.]MBW0171594.1 flagellar basal body-associated FliL family protein [Hydrogenophaga sp.]MBW0183024.1 flagellar basal body-associated FliL family protein [Hydrogenophaga sp.]
MSAAAATADATEAPKKKSKKLLFIILGVVVLALIGAGAALFILKKNTAHDDEEDGDAPVAVEHSKPKTPPTFLPLENMVINLADAGGNRFVQVGLTLQLQDTATETAVKSYLPKIRSNVLVLISQRTADEMLQAKGKEKLANDIIATISHEMGYEMPEADEADDHDAAPRKKKKKSKAPPNPVQAVLFSSFIVQ